MEYEELAVRVLQGMLQDRGLYTTGVKVDLIKRLQDYDKLMKESNNSSNGASMNGGQNGSDRPRTKSSSSEDAKLSLESLARFTAPRGPIYQSDVPRSVPGVNNRRVVSESRPPDHAANPVPIFSTFSGLDTPNKSSTTSYLVGKSSTSSKDSIQNPHATGSSTSNTDHRAQSTASGNLSGSNLTGILFESKQPANCMASASVVNVSNNANERNASSSLTPICPLYFSETTLEGVCRDNWISPDAETLEAQKRLSITAEHERKCRELARQRDAVIEKAKKECTDEVARLVVKRDAKLEVVGGETKERERKQVAFAACFGQLKELKACRGLTIQPSDFSPPSGSKVQTQPTQPSISFRDPLQQFNSVLPDIPRNKTQPIQPTTPTQKSLPARPNAGVKHAVQSEKPASVQSPSRSAMLANCPASEKALQRQSTTALITARPRAESSKPSGNTGISKGAQSSSQLSNLRSELRKEKEKDPDTSAYTLAVQLLHPEPITPKHNENPSPSTATDLSNMIYLQKRERSQYADSTEPADDLFKERRAPPRQSAPCSSVRHFSSPAKQLTSPIKLASLEDDAQVKGSLSRLEDQSVRPVPDLIKERDAPHPPLSRPGVDSVAKPPNLESLKERSRPGNSSSQSSGDAAAVAKFLNVIQEQRQPSQTSPIVAAGRAPNNLNSPRKQSVLVWSLSSAALTPESQGSSNIPKVPVAAGDYYRSGDAPHALKRKPTTSDLRSGFATDKRRQLSDSMPNPTGPRIPTGPKYDIPIEREHIWRQVRYFPFVFIREQHDLLVTPESLYKMGQKVKGASFDAHVRADETGFFMVFEDSTDGARYARECFGHFCSERILGCTRKLELYVHGKRERG